MWRLVDRATGGSSQNLDKLLDVAQERRDKGEFEEATRIANRVADAAVLGVQQAA
nr:hypothetical protein [Gemmatimonadota bacterium]NIU80355.1 hypothetical protein [Gammaproteobacteria bacterium]